MDHTVWSHQSNSVQSLPNISCPLREVSHLVSCNGLLNVMVNQFFPKDGDESENVWRLGSMQISNLTRTAHSPFCSFPLQPWQTPLISHPVPCKISWLDVGFHHFMSLFFAFHTLITELKYENIVFFPPKIFEAHVLVQHMYLCGQKGKG